MIKLTIDSREVSVPEGMTILQAADKLGIHIPRFCYHRKLSIAGNCRLCLVEVGGVKNPVISCKEPVREGMVVRTDSELARRARADTLEFVLRNHPLDCPVCDQSGECDLQDYYFEHSLRPSSLVDPKVRKPKAQQIGPHVMLDAERCVECTRCVRLCEEVLGVHEIGLFERGDHSTIGVLEGKKFSNPYSLCAVDICPVGALTSYDFRFKKRVWMLKRAPSICLGCATGCNIWVDHADGVIYRYRPRANPKVNDGLLCDAGRMTYKDERADMRIPSPMVRAGDGHERVGWGEAIARARELMRGTVSIVGVLSAIASCEENAAMAALCSDLLKVKKLCWSGRGRDPAFADEILRDADRNPNERGVLKFADERLSDVERGSGFIVLEGLSDDDAARIAASSPAWVILIGSRMPADIGIYDVMLPKPSHLEQAGTFVNRGCIEQRAAAAIAMPPDVRSVDAIARMFAEGPA